jgi:Protein of unknown function (DUF2721)
MTMMDGNHFIQQSLSPAIAISGIGLLILSLSNRIGVIGARIRELRRDTGKHRQNAQHIENCNRQIDLFMLRARLIRNALFLLYTSVSLIVLSEFLLALSQIEQLVWLSNGPIYCFLLSLLLVLIACVMEMCEVTVNLKTLKLEIHRGHPSFPIP